MSPRCDIRPRRARWLVSIKAGFQLDDDRVPEFFRLKDLAVDPPEPHPPGHFAEVADLEPEEQATVGGCLLALAGVPDLLGHPPGGLGPESQNDPVVAVAPHRPEAAAHVVFDIEVG